MRAPGLSISAVCFCLASLLPAQAQSLGVLHSACLQFERSGGAAARQIALFEASDGRIFLCVGELTVPNVGRPRIDNFSCRLFRSGATQVDDFRTAIIAEKGDGSAGVCGLHLTIQASLKTDKARFCAFEGAGEICQTSQLGAAKR